MAGLLTGKTPDQALHMGWAAGGLTVTTEGDVASFRPDQVEKFGATRVDR